MKEFKSNCVVVFMFILYKLDVYMSTTTYTTTIDTDHRAKRDDGRSNNTREEKRTEGVIYVM